MLSIFFSSKCNLFHNSNVFDSCIIHILYTGCAKIKKNNSGAKRLMPPEAPSTSVYFISVRNRGPCPLRSGYCLDLLNMSQWHGVVLFQRGTQQENCPTKHAVVRHSRDYNAWQSKWGFYLSNVDRCYYELRLSARRILKREWKAYCCIAKQET